MEKEKFESIIESLLFAAGSTLELGVISEIVEIDKKQVKAKMDEMLRIYNFGDRGLEIIEVEDSYQIRTNKTNFEYIKKLKKHKRSSVLSQASLETLAIIAYKQPITKPEVEVIRGVNCYNSVLRLMEHELIEETGRMDAPGKPIIYETTEEFLKTFGFGSINDLPSIEIFLENVSNDVNETNENQLVED